MWGEWSKSTQVSAHAAAAGGTATDARPNRETDRRGDLPRRNWGWFVARGALLVLLGVLSLMAPGAALFAFATVFAAFSFVDGMFAVISAVRGARDKSERWGALLFSGLVGIAVGVLFVLFPLVSTFAFAWVTVVLIAAWALELACRAAALRIARHPGSDVVPEGS